MIQTGSLGNQLKKADFIERRTLECRKDQICIDKISKASKTSLCFGDSGKQN